MVKPTNTEQKSYGRRLTAVPTKQLRLFAKKKLRRIGLSRRSTARSFLSSCWFTLHDQETGALGEQTSMFSELGPVIFCLSGVVVKKPMLFS